MTEILTGIAVFTMTMAAIWGVLYGMTKIEDFFVFFLISSRAALTSSTFAFISWII